jgi:hypothetical protein
MLNVRRSEEKKKRKTTKNIFLSAPETCIIPEI